jgi:glycosyltransferase involved in cell wall biosynthesis
MRVLIVHNQYQQAGGEDNVVRAESELLKSNGHDVEVWEENNNSIANGLDACMTALRCVYSIGAAREMGQRIAKLRPELVHVHNFFPRLSPSIYRVSLRVNVPIVQTLHNYRLLCPAATLQRDGRVCEECIGKNVPWPSVRHKCYRGSVPASVAVANMLSIHNLAKTWNRGVTQFISLSEFGRNKFIQGGLAREKIAVKPNFVDPDPGIGRGEGKFALFVGRLSQEKGIDVLLNAWRHMANPPRLKIIGDGPLASRVADAAATMPKIEWLGGRGRDEVLHGMGEATVLVFPSTWYEGFPLVLAEAFASGLPVIASGLGAMEEIVESGRTGRLFPPGQAESLARSVEWAFAHPERVKAMRMNARFEFLKKYTAKVNYAILENIYRSAIHACRDAKNGSSLQQGSRFDPRWISAH